MLILTSCFIYIVEVGIKIAIFKLYLLLFLIENYEKINHACRVNCASF